MEELIRVTILVDPRSAFSWKVLCIYVFCLRYVYTYISNRYATSSLGIVYFAGSGSCTLVTIRSCRWTFAQSTNDIGHRPIRAMNKFGTKKKKKKFFENELNEGHIIIILNIFLPFFVFYQCHAS